MTMFVEGGFMKKQVVTDCIYKPVIINIVVLVTETPVLSSDQLYL